MEATTLNNIGSVYFALGDLDAALENMTTAATLQHKIGAAWEEVTSHWWLGVIYQKQGQLDDAAAAVETAITLASKLNHPNLPDLQALLAEINAARKP